MVATHKRHDQTRYHNSDVIYLGGPTAASTVAVQIDTTTKLYNGRACAVAMKTNTVYSSNDVGANRSNKIKTQNREHSRRLFIFNGGKHAHKKKIKIIHTERCQHVDTRPRTVRDFFSPARVPVCSVDNDGWGEHGRCRLPYPW